MEIIPGTRIGDNYPTFFIAEIGQNHQGDFEMAKRMIVAATESGANCVKFQKSNLSAKFTSIALNRPYKNKNSWGSTYREHKEHLEFSEVQYSELRKFAEVHKVALTASGMDIPSINFLCDQLKVPFLKIGSGDANNIQLIEHAAKKHIYLVISTGMQDLDMVKKIYETVTKYHRKLCLMHCISAYPLPKEQINLKVLQQYHTLFPDIQIGYSGHEMGLDTTIAAVALGAKVIERHFTLDHHQVGSDHQCSLTPREFRLMVARIRNVEIALGVPQKQFQLCEVPCALKLGKSIVMRDSKREGDLVELDDLVLKVAEPPGLDGAKIDFLVGRRLNKRLDQDDSIFLTDLVDN